MTPVHASPLSFRRSGIVIRGLGWGGLCGVLAGAVAGTILWPLVGTFLGAVAGALIGAGFGLVGGGVLALVDTGRVGRRWLSLVNATTSGGCATVGVSTADVRPVTAVVFVVVSVLLGAAVGPRVARGPWVPADAAGPRPVADRAFGTVLDWLACGAAGGVGTGAAVAVAVGGVTGDAPPATVFAAVEGAFLGVPVGLLVGAAGAGAVVLGRIAARR